MFVHTLGFVCPLQEPHNKKKRRIENMELYLRLLQVNSWKPLKRWNLQDWNGFSLAVPPIHLKNMHVKLDHFPKDRDKNQTKQNFYSKHHY